MASSIHWLKGFGDMSAGETWNPIRARLKNGHPVKAAVPLHKEGWACVRVSPGCEHCYSETQNMHCGTNPTRLGTGMNYTVPSLDEVEIFLDEETLLKPLHWKKGRLIFPCSMTDWMADFVPDGFRDKMLAVMALTPQHTYLTLTKRADRQRDYFASMDSPEAEARAFNLCEWADHGGILKDRASQIALIARGLPNHWLGISAENQKYWDDRTRDLMATPASVRWVSGEPLLGEIDARNRLTVTRQRDRMIDWIVVGGESGPNARPCNIEWIRSLRDQCKAAGVPIFVKQLGAKPFLHKQKSVHIEKPGMKLHMESLEIDSSIHLNDPKGGDIAEWPADLRIREYPAMAERVSA